MTLGKKQGDMENKAVVDILELASRVDDKMRHAETDILVKNQADTLALVEAKTHKVMYRPSNKSTH